MSDVSLLNLNYEIDLTNESKIGTVEIDQATQEPSMTKAILLEDERDYPWTWFIPVIWSEADLRYRAAHTQWEECKNLEGAIRDYAA